VGQVFSRAGVSPVKKKQHGSLNRKHAAYAYAEVSLEMFCRFLGKKRGEEAGEKKPEKDRAKGHSRSVVGRLLGVAR